MTKEKAYELLKDTARLYMLIKFLIDGKAGSWSVPLDGRTMHAEVAIVEHKPVLIIFQQDS